MNLTKTSQFVRTGIKFLVGFIFIYYISTLFLGPQLKKFLKTIIPPKDPPTPIYGILDPLVFVEKPVNGPVPKYVLNTKTGSLPTKIPEKMTVYKVKPTKFSYLSGKNAIEDAAFLGYTESDLITDLKGTVFKWKNLKSSSLLEIKTESRELTVSTNFSLVPKEFAAGGISKEAAEKVAIGLFKTLKRYDDTYDAGKKNVVLGNLAGDQIVSAGDQKTAQVALVDLFRKIENYDVVTPDPKRGLLHAIVRNPVGTTTFNYPEVEAYYWEFVSPSQASYAVLDVEEAWKAVKNGKGVIANVTPKGSNPFAEYKPTKVETIYIDNVRLAYYETQKKQTYIQPIYVFEGIYTTKGAEGGSITIYFPAITADYTRQPTNTK